MRKILKSKLLFFVLGALIFGSISAVFAYTYASSEIGFASIDTTWEVENVNEAINYLHSPLKKYGTLSFLFQIATWDTSGTNHRGFLPIPSNYKSYKITAVDNQNSQYCNLYAHAAPDNHQVSINIGTEYNRADYPNVYVDMKPNSSSYTSCSVHITLYNLSS